MVALSTATTNVSNMRSGVEWWEWLAEQLQSDSCHFTGAFLQILVGGVCGYVSMWICVCEELEEEEEKLHVSL